MSDLMIFVMNANLAVGLASGTGPVVPIGRIILAFLFCVVLAIAAINFIRARSGMPLLPDRLRWRIRHSLHHAVPASDKVQIVQRLTVTPTSQLVVLKRGSQNYLLHLTSHGATEIDRFADEQDLSS